MNTIPNAIIGRIDMLRRDFGDEICRSAFASFNATFTDPPEPEAPPLDAAELRRWAVEQALKLVPIDNSGWVIGFANDLIAYVIGEQTP